MVSGDVYQSSWDDLKKKILNYSMSTMKKGRGYWSATSKEIRQGISKLEISNLLSYFKKDIIKDFIAHLDTMIAKKKHVEVES